MLVAFRKKTPEKLIWTMKSGMKKQYIPVHIQSEKRYIHKREDTFRKRPQIVNHCKNKELSKQTETDLTSREENSD